MNWGTKLMIGMGLFIIFIVTMGYIMIYSKTDALVDTDYYEKGIRYDEDYQKKEQGLKDGATPEIQINEEEKQIVLQFANAVSGDVLLLRPDNKRLDQNHQFQSDSDHQVKIPALGLIKGRWHLVINWTNSGKAYLYEKEIYLP